MFFYHMQAALRYGLHESWWDFLIFVRGEDFINDDGGKLRIAVRLHSALDYVAPDMFNSGQVA
jgi:hypothetical protein